MYDEVSLITQQTGGSYIFNSRQTPSHPHPNKHKMPINYTPGKTTVDFLSLWGTTRIQVLSDSMSQPQPQSCRLKVNLLWKSPLAGQRHDLLYLFTNNLLVLIDNGAVLLTRFLIRFSIKWRQNGSQNFICDNVYRHCHLQDQQNGYSIHSVVCLQSTAAQNKMENQINLWLQH